MTYISVPVNHYNQIERIQGELEHAIANDWIQHAVMLMGRLDLLKAANQNTGE